jgi:hypothetical protein
MLINPGSSFLSRTWWISRCWLRLHLTLGISWWRTDRRWPSIEVWSELVRWGSSRRWRVQQLDDKREHAQNPMDEKWAYAGRAARIWSVEKSPTARRTEQGVLANSMVKSAVANARAHGEGASQFVEVVAERILWRELGKDSASSDTRSKARSRSGGFGHKHTQRFTVSSARVTDLISTTSSFAGTTDFYF